MDIFEKLKKLSAERETAMGKPEYIIVGLGNPAWLMRIHVIMQAFLRWRLWKRNTAFR